MAGVVQGAVSKDQQHAGGALHRDLSLTQYPVLPYENNVTAGEFIGELPSSVGAAVPVSVESELASKLSIGLGDQLEFLIQGRPLLAFVSSLRAVNWENFRPNFYMIFPVGSLDSFGQSTLTSFYLPPQHAALEREINQRFAGLA